MRTFALLLLLTLGLSQTGAQTDVPLTGNLGADFRTACWKGDLAGATKMLNAGAPLEESDSHGRTPLLLAAHINADIVKLLLDKGAKVGVVSQNGDTPMGQACEYGNLASAQLLVKAGAELDRPNMYGRTPLMLAAREGRDELVAFLIAHHVDVNSEGRTFPAIYYAAVQDHIAVVKMLLAAGAHVTYSSNTILQDAKTEPIVSAAAYTNDLPLVDLLLDHGADINGKDTRGRSALMYAVQSVKPETIMHLLARGAEINAQDNKGATPMMLSLNYKTPAFEKDLVDHGAKLEMRDQQGRTALMWACKFALNQHIRVLVEQGADINATDNNGNTPLIYAANRGDLEGVQYFKDKGAKLAELHVISRGAPLVALKTAKAWALAVGAIYAQHNGVNPQVIGYETDDTDDEQRDELKRDWEITDRASFLKQVDELGKPGQRADMQKIGALVAPLDDEQFSAQLKSHEVKPKLAAALRAIRASFKKWKDRSGLAWDLCRRASMINTGYSAHYLTEDEAWELLLDNARQIQAGFQSWQEMSDNFLDGREIWAGKRDPSFEACAQLLTNSKDTNSPWTQLPWASDLSGL